MSRRASLLAKQEKRKPRVRFPDELVFLDNIKGNDIQACHSMLRRASVQLDINGLDNSGLTPLHNAVLEGNLAAVKLLLQHGADINRKDIDTWTPLHAACANGESDIARFLLSKGASKDIKTNDGERPLDLCDAKDFGTISVMLESDTARKARLSVQDEEGEECSDEEDCKRNDNSDDNKDEKRSDNSGSCPGSTDSSPDVPRRNNVRNKEKDDIRNANSPSRPPPSSKSNQVKGVSNLRALLEKNSLSPTSASTLSVSPSRQRNSPSPTSRKSPTSQMNNEPPVSIPLKPAGRSILKKSPQQFKTVAE